MKLNQKSFVNISYFYNHRESSHHSSEKWAMVMTTNGDSGWIRDRYLKY